MLVEVHPTAERLTAFGLGRLDEAESVALEAHLADCETCRRALETQAADSFVTLAREVRSDRTSANGLAHAAVPAAPTCALTETGTPASSEVPAELADHPRYRILGLLGVGGMGAVFKAEHLLMHRVVALKVINRRLVANPAMVERFTREVIAAGSLSHPNIVHYHDAEHIVDTHFLVMEYVDGINLAKLMGETGPLTIALACDFTRQVALGLQHAFERGMVHRDIKPQNLMLALGSTVKILDFGLARLAQETTPTPMERIAETAADCNQETPSCTLTQIGTVMGTPDYIAPEQARDAHAADIRSDIYSLGCTLYDLLTGKPPFPQGTVMQKVIAHLEQAPRPVTEIRPEAPSELARVVERMLAKDPAQRYQTPVEVAEALAPFTKSEPEASAKIAEPVAHPKSPGRHRLRLALAASLATIAAVAIACYFVPLVQDFAQTVIRIATNKGVLEIVTDDEDLEITIKQAGKAIASAVVVNKKTKRTFELTAIDGEIEVRERGPDGFGVKSTSPFQMTRGDKVTLTARMLVAEKVPALVVEARFQPLFNGKDLDGWEGDKGTWSWKDNTLVGKTERGLDGPRAYLWNSRKYQDFELKFQVRCEGGGGGGIGFRGKLGQEGPVLAIRSPVALFSIWHYDGGLNCGSLLDTATNKALRRANADVKEGEFNEYLIRVNGKHVTIEVNGSATVDGMVPELPNDGILAWQVLSGHQATITIRNIEIKELPPEKPAAQKSDVEKLQGVWQAIELEQDGVVNTIGLKVINWYFTFDGERAQLKGVLQRAEGPGEPVDMKGICLVDANATPKRFRVAMPVADKRINQLIGIFDFQGDRLRLCYRVEEQVPAKVEYPSVFATKPGSPLKMMTFKRVPPAEPGSVQLFNGKGEFINPAGDCKVVADRGRLRITIPGNARLGRLLDPATDMSAPRVLQEVEGDFVAQVKIHAFSRLAENIYTAKNQRFRSFAGAGLLVWLDESRFASILREEIEGNPDAVAAAESHCFGIQGPKIRYVPESPTYLQIERRGGVLTMRHGGDGKTWQELHTSPEMKLPKKLKVGVAAVNNADVEYTFMLEDFKIDRAFRPLFNGKDIGGWNVVNVDSNGAWKVENGHLIGKAYQARLRTDRMDFTDFHLRLEAKYVVGGGILLMRSQPADNSAGFQIHMNNMNSDYRTGAISTVVNKKWHSAFPDKQFTRPGEWFTLEVIAQGNCVKTIVNGKQVVDFPGPDNNVTKGFLQLEVTGIVGRAGENPVPAKDGELHIRKIEIKELPTTPPEPAFQPLFNGKDLSGWVGDAKNWKVEGRAIVFHGKDSSELRTENVHGNYILRFEHWVEAVGSEKPYFTLMLNEPTPEESRIKDRARPRIRFTQGGMGQFEVCDYKGRELEPLRYFHDKKAKVNGWNKVEIHNVAGQIELICNDQDMGTIKVDKADKGLIALKPAGRNWGGELWVGEWSFRNIEIQTLPAGAALPRGAFRPLFPAKNLDSWNVTKEVNCAWDAEGLKIKADLDSGSTHLWSKQKFKDYEVKLQLQFRSVNSEFRIVPRMMDSKDVGKFAGVKALAIGFTRPDLGKQVITPINAASARFKQDGFNEITVRCLGKRVMVRVNGETMTDGDLPELFAEGSIAFHITGPAQPEVLLRNVEIREVAPKAP